MAVARAAMGGGRQLAALRVYGRGRDYRQPRWRGAAGDAPHAAWRAGGERCRAAHCLDRPESGHRPAPSRGAAAAVLWGARVGAGVPAVDRGRRWHAERPRSERRHTTVPHGVAGLRGAALARLRQGPAHQADHARARLGARRGAPTAVAGGSYSSAASEPCGPLAWPGADVWPCERRRRSSSSTTRRSTLTRRQRHANAAAGLRPHGNQRSIAAK